jgi:hypothetical protein
MGAKQVPRLRLSPGVLVSLTAELPVPSRQASATRLPNGPRDPPPPAQVSVLHLLGEA